MYSNGGIYIPDRKPPMGAVRNPYLKINRGLVGDWMMWEGAGPTVEDLSGNGNTGTITGSDWRAGKFGSSLYFDNTDKVVLANVLPVTHTQYTWILWFKNSIDNLADSALISNIYRTVVRITSADVLRLYIYDDIGWQSVETANTYNDGIWHQMAAVIQQDVGIELFVDAISCGTDTCGTLDGRLVPTYFGNIANGTTPANSDIDNVAYYNRTLIPAEILQLTQEPFCGFRWASIEQLAVYEIGGEDFSRTFDDGVGIVDAMSRSQALSRTITDGVGTADTIGRTQVQVRTLAETLGLTDAIWKAETKIFADAVGIADAITKTQAFARTIADDVGLVDSESELITYVRTLTESLEITDIVSKTVSFPRTISDDVGITDSVTKTAAFARVIAEAMGISDVVTKTQAQLRTIADAMGLTDVMQPGQLVVFAEAMGINDTMTHTKTQIRVIADSLGITDDLTRIATYVFTQTDDIDIGDAMIRVAVALRTISDDVGMTDEMAAISELVKAAWAFMLLKKSN